RLLVTSAAYRMRTRSAPEDPATAGADPDNRWLWHFRTRRMEAEVVRDSLLYLAGDLDSTMGGPEVDNKLGSSVQRRSIYFAHFAEDNGRMKFLEVFNAANPRECYRRVESIMPQQALAMANSELVSHEGRALARRLSVQVGNSSLAAPDDEIRFVR